MSDKTFVTFLLDRSGSMGSIRNSTIEAFNAYLSTLQEEPAGIHFTFLQFDTQSLDKLCVGKPIADVPLLTPAIFVPRGGTPLIDAAVKTIRATEEAVVSAGGKPKVVICIQTDGEENSSSEHTIEELRGLIATRTAKGWQFNFMGAGVDAYAQAAVYGIGTMNTMTYDSASPDLTKRAFVGAASNTRSYAVGRSLDTNFSTAQRTAAGDQFVPSDLGGTRKIRTARHTTRRKIVPDFKL